MSAFTERYASSLELPNPADLPGEIVLCYERGVSQCCAWQATGGETGAVWQPLGYSYVGLVSGRPAANTVRARAQAWTTDIGGGRFYSDGTTWIAA